MSEKGIVFCHTCNQIVGDSFPVYDHYHKDFGNGSMSVWMLQKCMLGFGWYKDTKKIRKQLAKDFPPRTKLEIEI